MRNNGLSGYVQGLGLFHSVSQIQFYPSIQVHRFLCFLDDLGIKDVRRALTKIAISESSTINMRFIL